MRTQTFGIEIETTGLGRQRTAEVIAKFFGTTAQYIGAHLDDWKIHMPDGRKWTVESDGSVTDPSAEVVSPVCRWEDIEMVQEVVRTLRKAGAKVDSTCGIHIHIGLGDHTPRTLRNLVNIVNAKEDLLTQYEGYPTYYTKHRRRVVMDDGSEIRGMVYIMNMIRPQPPTASYYNAIHNAYVKLGLRSEIEQVLEPALQRSQRRKQFSLW